jgi:hypothetical protein
VGGELHYRKSDFIFRSTKNLSIIGKYGGGQKGKTLLGISPVEGGP